jgi:hypothetical protein
VSNNHVITRNIGNLRGFSTDSIFTRPSNVAEAAINIQKAPDGTTQIRRGYQCQAAAIGGNGINTFDNAALDQVQTITVGLDGYVYNKITSQLFFDYDGQVSGTITGITNANPAEVTSVAHGLISGTVVYIEGVAGMTEVNNNYYTISVVDVDHFDLFNNKMSGPIEEISQANPAVVESTDHGLETGNIVFIQNVLGMTNVNNLSFTITVIDENNFSLNGVNSLPYPQYISGGQWINQSGAITGISKTNPAVVTSPAHGLTTGNIIFIENVQGMINVNDLAFTITVIDSNNFSLNGVNAIPYPNYTGGGNWIISENSTLFPLYISGGEWIIGFTYNRWLSITIFTDPVFLVNSPNFQYQPWTTDYWATPANTSISCSITVNQGAQITQSATNTNTITVAFGQTIQDGNVIQFYTSTGVLNQANVIAETPTSLTFDGPPVSVNADTYVSIFYYLPMGKGFDEITPLDLDFFIAAFTEPLAGVQGLEIYANGPTKGLPAAFLQIFEPRIVDNNSIFSLDYWWWNKINSTVGNGALPPLPGSASLLWQNSEDYEICSMAAFENIIFIANGWDFPNKYDGQTVFRSGMPLGIIPVLTQVISSIYTNPFALNDAYEYATTYEQIDNQLNVVEGQISSVVPITIGSSPTPPASINVSVTNLISSPDNNWNTNCAIVNTPLSSLAYGPDINGFYYITTTVNSGYTLKIGDSAYYLDQSAGIAGAVTNSNIIPVDSTNVIQINDIIYLKDTSSNELQRVVKAKTSNTITVDETPVTIPSQPISDYIVSKVFGDVAISSSTVTDTNTFNVIVGHTLQVNDLVNYIDVDSNLQLRTITALIGGTQVVVSGYPTSIEMRSLIYSQNQQPTTINLQRPSSDQATFFTAPITQAPISNNLRINIYRTKQGEEFPATGELFLIAAIPNDSITGTNQNYVDSLADAELGIELFQDPDFPPDPPPVSKYVCSFGNQIFYAGGERGVSQFADYVFFSISNFPENVTLSTNFITVANTNDDITGIGVSGSSLVITKDNSLWACTGNFISGQINVVQIAQGSNIGCAAHATISSVGTLMYFLHTNGVYAISENQLFPTDPFGNPIPLSLPIDVIFRERKFLPQSRYVFKRAVAINYPKDNQYLLFLPCEYSNSSIRTANPYSTILCYDYQGKNWYYWINMNAASGMAVIDDNLYFQERRFSGTVGNTANLYKQHRFYRLIDHADHSGPQIVKWLSSWEDLGQPEVRKKFCRCVLLMDRISDLQQLNTVQMNFTSYLNRLPNLANTSAVITPVDNVRNSPWSTSPWGWGYWSGYQDTFITINLRGGTVAKSLQVGFEISGINMDIRFSGVQLEVIPENRKTVVR